MLKIIEASLYISGNHFIMSNKDQFSVKLKVTKSKKVFFIYVPSQRNAQNIYPSTFRPDKFMDSNLVHFFEDGIKMKISYGI